MPDDGPPTEPRPDGDGDGRADRLRTPRASITVRDAVTVVVAVALLVGLTGLVYVAVTPQQSVDPYTEFYVLNSEDRAADYPTNLTVGERATVVVGVVNHEEQRMTYTLLVRADGRTLVTRRVDVDRDQRWEDSVSYSFDSPGRVRVRFLLYRGTDPEVDTDPYRTLRLWTNVSAPAA